MEHSSEPNGVPRETLDRFAALLLRWNRTVNLVAPNDEAAIWERHIADSLQLVPLMVPLPNRAIDLGSGAGFPGMILAIVTGVPFDLIEADKRKAAFLREAARVTGAPVRIHATRIQGARIPPAPLVTARALAALPKLLALATPLLTRDGFCLFPKGGNACAELTEAAAQWHMEAQSVPSRTAPDACILRISQIDRVAPAT